MVDAEPRGGQRRQQHRTSLRISLPLLLFVIVIVQGCDHGGLHRRRHHHPGMSAHRQQLGDQFRIPGDKTRAVPGQRRTLRQRVHCQQPGVITTAHRRMQHRQRLGIPGQAQIALVRGHDDAPSARPLDYLLQVLHAQHTAGGVARRVQIQQGRRLRAQLSQRVSPLHPRARQPRTHLIGRVRQLRNHHRIRGPQTQQCRQPGDELLGADHRQDRRLGQLGDAVPASQGGHCGFPQASGARGGGIARREGGGRQRFLDQRRDGIHRGTDGEVDDAVRMRPGPRFRLGQRVPGEFR